MTVRRSTATLLLCAISLAGGLILGAANPQFASSSQGCDAPTSLPYSMRERLGANLYIQTAAEYRACCLQTYRLTEMRLELALSTTVPRPTKPAVVMDLDETVFDNSAFESFLYETHQEYSDALWEVYERDYPSQVALVPGAKEFIRKAEAMGVTAIYISNRLEKHKQSTIAALQRLGLNVHGIDDRLYLKADTSDKTARRANAAGKYNVLLILGDNLRDFSEAYVAPKLDENASAETYSKAIQERLQRVDDAACHWGQDWLVFPNPGYGEWERLIGKEPERRLRPSGMNQLDPRKS
jgi:5'-nucleotidase (lipoprotein e(P4) family)